MSQTTYFIQRCADCGRSREVIVEELGTRVPCPHCQNSLMAVDFSSEQRSVFQKLSLLDYAHPERMFSTEIVIEESLFEE